MFSARGLGGSVEIALEWCLALTSSGPAIVVLDDMHWASVATQRLLRHLVPLLPAGLMMIVVTREDRSGPDTATSFMGTGDSICRLAVSPLDADGLRTLAAQLGVEPTPHELDAVLAATGGSPMLASEYLMIGGPPVDRSPAVERIHRLLRPRLDELSPVERSMLDVLAVAGADMDVPLLTSILAASPTEIVATFDDLERSRWAVISRRPTLSCTVAHDVIRVMVLEQLGPSRTAALHATIATALERRFGRRMIAVEAIAHHRLESLPFGSAHLAANAGRRAARRALNLSAPRDAASWLDRVAALTTRHPESRSHSTTLAMLGLALDQAGDPGLPRSFANAAELALRLGDRELVRRIVLTNHWGVPRPDPEWRFMVECALISFEWPTTERAMLLAECAVQSLPDVERIADLSDEALRLAREADDPDTLSFVLHRTVMASWSPASLMTRLDLIDERRHAASASASAQWSWFVEMQACATALEAGMTSLADQALHRQIALCRRRISPHSRAFTDTHRAWAALALGDLRSATCLAESSIAIAGPDDPAARANHAALQFAIRSRDDWTWINRSSMRSAIGRSHAWPCVACCRCVSTTSLRPTLD